MALKAIVKISSITNLSDARYCAGMGVDMLGFDLNPQNTEYVNPLKFQEITGWVAGVTLVGEVHGLSEEEIRAQLVQYPVDCLELSDPQLLKALESTGVSFIFRAKSGAVNLTSLAALASEHYPALKYVFIELDGTFSPTEIATIAWKAPLLLGYHIEAENALSLMKQTGLKGFVLKGGNEIKAGFKDYDELASLFEVLEA